MEPPVGFATDLDGDGAELALGADDESEVDLLAGELMGGVRMDICLADGERHRDTFARNVRNPPDCGCRGCPWMNGVSERRK